ncbi:MAG: hypothetical protein ACOX1A_07535 [Saccharofermentanales bacterium]
MFKEYAAYLMPVNIDFISFLKKSCIATRTIKKEANEGAFSQALQVARNRRSAIDTSHLLSKITGALG